MSLQVWGMVVPYDQWSLVDNHEGHFLEKFAVGSLRESFSERAWRRIRGFYEHARSSLFGSQPVMQLTRVWEEPSGGFFEGELLDGLPETVVDGVRRGLYGASLGAEPVKVDRVRFPKRSHYNPEGLEERIYRSVEVFDISLTPRPHYAGTTVAVRSRTGAPAGAIYRASPGPVVVAPAWALEPPAPRDYLADPDYLADEPIDYLDDAVLL